MKCGLGLVLLWASLGIAAERPFRDLLAEGLAGWREPTGAWAEVGDVRLHPDDPRRLQARDGRGVIWNGPDGRTVNLLTREEFGDVELHVEFFLPRQSNSGVYLMGRYEIQIFDSHGVERPQHSDCGGIYQRWANGRGFEGHPPRTNAAQPAGEWQTFHIIFRAPRFDAEGRKIAPARFERVVHNGVVIHENVEVSGPTRAAAFSDERPTGPLMLQGDHGPIAYRNLRIRPLRHE